MWVNPGEVAGDGRDNDGNGYVDDVHGINAALNNGNPMDDHGHGTHVAGTIGATGSDGGFVGVNWDVQIMALKFLTADGGGSTADAIEALNYAAAMRQRGVNLKLTNSWGGGGYEQALRDAIAHQANLGILFVAAAGNDGLNNDAYGSFPANVDLPNVISVAAADRNDALASFSNYGATSVNLSAPGVDIASTAPGGSYVYMSGTSMATPHVSGVAALAWAVKPDATYQEVRDAILGGVDKLPALAGRTTTGGRLNALNTLNALTGRLSGTLFDDADGNGVRGAAEGALGDRLVYLEADGDAALDAATAAVSSTNVPLTIPDPGTATSVLTVSGLSGAVTDVDVKLDVTHTYASDLRAYLIAPNGRTVQLFGDVGGSGDHFTGTTLDDEAAAAIYTAAAPFAGRYLPQDSLAALDGVDANGTWRLRLTDAYGYDAGTLRSWSVTLATRERSVKTDAAGNYAFAGLAPGNYAVRQVLPAGWVQTSPAAGSHAVQFAEGQGLAGNDFGSRVAQTVVVADANDQISEAVATGVGYALNGAVDDPTDVDVLAFMVVAGQRVGFDVDQPTGSTLDSYLRVFDGAGVQLAANNNGAASGETQGTASYVEYTFATAGTYYVAVSGNPNGGYDALTGAGDAAGGTGAFTLSLVNRTAGSDTDDQLGEAKAATVGATLSGLSISAGTDVDLYKFTVSAGQRVGFDTDRTSTTTFDSYLRLFDATGAQLAANDNGAAPGEGSTTMSYLEYTFATGGTYFVGVSGSPNRTYNAATGGGDVSGRTGGYTLGLINRGTTVLGESGGTAGAFSEVRVADALRLERRNALTEVLGVEEVTDTLVGDAIDVIG